MNLDELKQKAKETADQFDLLIGGRVDAMGRRNELMRALYEFGKELLGMSATVEVSEVKETAPEAEPVPESPAKAPKRRGRRKKNG